MRIQKVILACAGFMLTAGALLAFPYDDKNSIKFGKVDDAELEMTSYELDTGASAVILADIGSSSLEYNSVKGDFEMVYERHCRIKILKNTGYEYANIEIPVYNSSSTKQYVSNLKAFTYNLENGKMQKDKMSRKSTFEEKYNENWNLFKFTLPNVKVGSVFEFTFRITSDYPRIRTWEFQKDIPVMWSEYVVSIPEYYNYLQIGQGYEPFYKSERKSESKSLGTGSGSPLLYTVEVYYWAAKDMPGLANEKHITTPEDFATKMEFQLATYQPPYGMLQKILSDWPEIEKTLLDHSDFGSQIDRGNFLRKDLEALLADCSEEACKAVKIYNHIKQQINWDGNKRLICSKNIKKTYDERVGNSADINLLLVAALRQAGLKADPVILSTRDHGRIHPVYPMIDKYNYVVAHAVVDNKPVLLDATDKYLNFGQLPERCLNFKGRLISPSHARWIDLDNLGESVSMITAELNLSELGELEGKLSIASTGYDAINTRKRIIDNEDDYLKDLRDRNDKWEIVNHQFLNLKDLNEKLVCEYELKMTDMAQGAGDVIFINPLLSEGLDENPFKQETRKYPVDMTYPQSHIIHMTLNLPEGYEVDEIPEPARIALPNNAGAFSFNVTKLGEKLQVVSSYNLKKAFFMPEEYGSLKEFHDIVVAKCAEQVVLKKKQL